MYISRLQQYVKGYVLDTSIIRFWASCLIDYYDIVRNNKKAQRNTQHRILVTLSLGLWCTVFDFSFAKSFVVNEKDASTAIIIRENSKTCIGAWTVDPPDLGLSAICLG